MPNLGELFIILFIVLLVFGAAKMPALGDRLGRAIGQARRTASAPPHGKASKSR